MIIDTQECDQRRTVPWDEVTKNKNVNALTSYRYYEDILKNSTGPWSVWGNKSHSCTWDVLSLVNLACDQKNPDHEPDRVEHWLSKLWENSTS